MNKKITAAIAGTGAAALTAALAITADPTADITGTYSISEVNPYTSVLSVAVPEEFTPDICELKLNDISIAKTLLPGGDISTYPVILSEPDRLSMDMYVRGDIAATAVFNDDGTITITVDKKYIRDGSEEVVEYVE